MNDILNSQICEVVETSAMMCGITLPANWREQYDRLCVVLRDFDGVITYPDPESIKAIRAKAVEVLKWAKELEKP